MTTCTNCGLESEVDFKFCPGCGTQAVASSSGSADPMLGRTLSGKYRVLAMVGSGSMGRVYAAEHLSLKKKVALKILHPDLLVSEESLKRFQREGIAAGKFNHPGAIQIFDFDKDESGSFYLAMEFVEGPNLKAFLAESGRLPPDVAIDLACQVLRTLGEAHRHGIVHRDLKPDNIMVVSGAAGPSGALTAKVLDFGLVKLIDLPLDASLQTQAGRILGTPRYMAPEQWTGAPADHRTDLYAAGLILYEMVAGHPPFYGEDISETMVKSTTEPPPSILDTHPDLRIPHELDEVLAQALEKRPADRFQSAEAMIEALESVGYDKAARRKGTARHKAPRHAVRPHTHGAGSRAGAAGGRGEASRSRLPLALGAVLLLAAVGIGAYLVFADGSSGATEASGKSRAVALSQRDPQSLSEDERRYVALLQQARDALRGAGDQEALAALDEAIRMECKDAEAYVLRGRAYRQRGDDDAAMLEFRDALKLDARNAAAAANLGWVHLDKGEPALAAAWFEDAAEFDPHSADALCGQGALQLADGNTQAALELLGRAEEIDPDSATVQCLIGETRVLIGDMDGAVEAFLRAKRADSGSWQAYAGLGRCYRDQDRLDEAAQQLREAVRLEPDADRARADLAAILVDSERFAEAITTIDEALQRGRTAGKLHVLKGVALHGQDKIDDAIQSLERGVRATPAAARARTLLGVLYQQKGRHQDAIEQYQAALQVDDRLAAPNLNQGLALIATGRHAEAVPFLEQAAWLDPDDSYPHWVLGVLFMDYLGDPARALGHFNDYQALGGDDPRVGGFIQRLSR